MPIEVRLETPLAEALNMAIQPKLTELGWGTGGADDSALTEYIVLMLVNGKTQDEIATELSNDLLGLGPDDPGAREFSRWLFEQIEILNSRLNSAGAPAAAGTNNMTDSTHDDSHMDFETDMNSTDIHAEINAPTGPKSMRMGNFRGGREKRMMGQINRALDRSQESVLHRTRSPSGISRTPPIGPRMGVGRQPRVTNSRASSIAAGMANMSGGMGGLPSGPATMGGMHNGMHSPMNNGWGVMPPQQPGQMDIFTMLEQQQQMIQQMLMAQQHQPQRVMMHNNGNSPNHGKPLFERVQKPHGNNFRRGGGPTQQNGHHNVHNAHNSQVSEATKPTEATTASVDVDMSQAKPDAPSPDETLCKYNLRCTNKDCKFAHQSPAAPPGTTVDVKDICTFGVACKNRKCVGRHPSPAGKVAHQSEMDCKFYPNCQNPRCPFRHPATPPCRNGGECKVPNCKFTHVKTACKFRPCTNRYCPFTHEEGQRGTFQDKVWVADEAKEHVSERKFVDENSQEELVLPDDDQERHGLHELRGEVGVVTGVFGK